MDTKKMLMYVLTTAGGVALGFLAYNAISKQMSKREE
jgi:hypothetical protein